MSATPDPVRYIDKITQRYERLGYEPYRWFKAAGPPPFAPLARPLSQSRLGMLTTAGCYAAGQVAFHYKDDTSIRRIPIDTPVDRLRFSHLTENYLADGRKDPDCLVPVTALQRLRDEGRIGSLAPEFVSCMGGVYSQRRTREEMIPAIEQAFVELAVDTALLVPM